MISAFSLHEDRGEAIRRGQEGFDFFGYALNALVAQDAIPGRSQLWPTFEAQRGDRTEQVVAAAAAAGWRALGIGTPEDMRHHVQGFREAGLDQIVFLQQAGRNRHDHICEALELFAQSVMPEFRAEIDEREATKAKMLAPYIAAALARKQYMRPLADAEIPIVQASVAKAQISGSLT
jgi:hypothetical protein